MTLARMPSRVYSAAAVVCEVNHPRLGHSVGQRHTVAAQPGHRGDVDDGAASGCPAWRGMAYLQQKNRPFRFTSIIRVPVAFFHFRERRRANQDGPRRSPARPIARNVRRSARPCEPPAPGRRHPPARKSHPRRPPAPSAASPRPCAGCGPRWPRDAPSWANRSAVWRPMPDEPPVMMAILSFSLSGHKPHYNRRTTGRGNPLWLPPAYPNTGAPPVGATLVVALPYPNSPEGRSINCWNRRRNAAATAPSITWWSEVRLTVSISLTTTSPPLTTGFWTGLPTPSIELCPALRIGVKPSTVPKHAYRERAADHLVGRQPALTGRGPPGRASRPRLRICSCPARS